LISIRKIMGCAAILSSFATAALAQNFPSKPVEFVNSATPGGGSDIFLRMLAAVSAEHLGGEIVVISKPGGRSIVAMNYVNSRPRDGHTLEVFTPGQLQQVALGKSPFTFDQIEPVVVGTVDPVVLVSKAGTFKDAHDAIAQGKKRPLKTGGTEMGDFEWLAITAFANAAGLQKPIYVPLGGGGAVILNTIGGTLEVGVANLTEITDQVKAGELDALLVMADERSPALPDVPTGKELGLELNMAQARGLIALKGTPEPVLAKLEGALLKGMQSEKYQSYLKQNGLGPDSIGGREKWGKMMKSITDVVMQSYAELNAAQQQQKK